MAAALAARGHKVTVLARKWLGGGEAAENDPLLAGVRIRRLADDTLGRSRWILEVLREALVHDIVHAHTARLGYLAARVARRVPLVLTVHGYLLQETLTVEPALPWLKRRLYEHIETTALRKADALLTVDEGLARWAQRIAARDVTKLPNALIPGEYRTVPQEGRRHELVCARHLYPKCGVEYAVQATALLEAPWRLVVIGGGPLQLPLSEMARAVGVGDRVQFLGVRPRREVVARAGEAFAALVPSVPVEGVEEATSVAALEAMACGTAVVASRIGGLREIIRDGQTGFLVEPRSPRAIAECLLQLAGDAALWRRISEGARHYVEVHHNWLRQVVRVEEVYESALRVHLSQASRGSV